MKILALAPMLLAFATTALHATTSDVAKILSQAANTPSDATPLAPVPEPYTFALLVIGLSMLFVMGRLRAIRKIPQG